MKIVQTELCKKGLITKGGCKHDNTSHTCIFFYYFCLYFGKYSYNILGIILKKSSIFLLKKSYYFIKVYVKILEKMSFSKIIKSIYKSFYCLKANVIMFNECFF